MIKAHYPLSIITQLLLVIALLISVPLTADATPIDYSRAAKIAQKYITLPNGKNFKAQVSQRHSNSDTPYYIFNDAHGRGFVIVAGNDVMGEILAYSTENTLDTLNANPCVKWLLEGYRQTYDDVKNEKVAASQASPRAATFLQTVSPLLKTKWGQSHPFNAQTGYPYSGCVATAVAQMMYYYQWPTHGFGKNEYTVTYDQTTKSADFSQSYYDWDNMLLDYRYPVRATTIQENAVAQLMSDVGIASSMQYTPSSSGTQGIFAYQALQKHFDYTAAYVTRAIEGPSRFASILRQELLNGCPVYLEGRPANTASGHAWVADGFDENGLFHMNFGWDGQGDAYYSLTNLSLSQTGGEFQGKPLAFNRAVTAILAHPNNGKYPDIDRGLLESSPQLMFNEGGSLTLNGTEDKSFSPSQPQTVELNSFVNRGASFKGDVGIAVCNDAGEYLRIFYSDDHANGGFTERIYGADHDGFMGTDYLVNQPLHVQIRLAGLSNGYYRLIPVCVSRNDDGTWSDFFRMKKAPTIEVELTDDAGRVSEVCSDDAQFQLMAQPRLSAAAERGGKVQSFFTVKNLNGVPRDCYMRVQLLDEHQEVVLDSRVDECTEMEGFSDAEFPITLSLPTNLSPGRYEVKLLLSADKEGTLFYPINKIHDKDVPYIEVIEAQENPLMAKVEVFLADDSNNKIEGGSVDLSQMSPFKLAVSLRTSEDKCYSGPITMLTEDVQTKEKFYVRGIDDEVYVSPSFDVPLFSYWLRKDNISWEDGHAYRLIVMGQIDGQDVELDNPKEASYYLKCEGDMLTLFQQNVVTGTSSTSTCLSTTKPFSVKRKGDDFIISAHDLFCVSMYNVSGRLVKRALSADGRQGVLSLRKLERGIYLLHIECDGGRHTYNEIVLVK